MIKENLTASIWRELENNGKFDKNEKLSFISDDTLILGCDVVHFYSLEVLEILTVESLIK